MPAKAPKKVRGVFEHPKDSRIWWIQYFEHGRRHRERVGRRSDAITLYQKRKTQIIQGDKLPELKKRRPLFGELLDDVVLHVRTHHKAPRSSTVKAALLREAFGDRRAEEIRAVEFAAWIDARHVSPATFNRYKAFLSLCYREAILAKKVAANPARELRSRREPRGRKRFLDRDEEFPALMAAVAEHFPAHLPAVTFSLFTGARLSEQFALTWSRVDFTRRELHLVDTKNGDDRTLPMNSLVLQVLKDLRKKAVSRTALVFGDLRTFCWGTRPARKVGVDGEGFSPKWFRDLCVQLEIEDYTWHNNRHTFCSWLAIAGVPLKTIQELAGHRTLQMTARYAHLSPQHTASEIEKLVTPPKSKAG